LTARFGRLSPTSSRRCPGYRDFSSVGLHLHREVLQQIERAASLISYKHKQSASLSMYAHMHDLSVYVRTYVAPAALSLYPSLYTHRPQELPFLFFIAAPSVFCPRPVWLRLFCYFVPCRATCRARHPATPRRWAELMPPFADTGAALPNKSYTKTRISAQTR
jgi:hypothetical protein